MTQNLNQFEIQSEKGLITSSPNINVFAGQISSSESSDTVAAQALKLSTDAGEQTIVTAATNTTDAIFGFQVYDVRRDVRSANEQVRVATNNSIMYMEASAAIARGAELEYVVTGQKVATQSTGTVIGISLDIAAADGDLIRVLIKSPF